MKNLKKVDLSTKTKQVILASNSPIRAKLLRENGINIKIINHLANEDTLKKQYKSKKLTLSNYLALAKVKSIEHLYKRRLIIGSDQILICENKLISKPRNKIDALENLLFLRNKEHTLISSVCLLTDKKEYLLNRQKATVFMKHMSAKKIRNYINENQDIVFSTVGSYKIENDKLNCLKIINGTMETILGFPIEKFLPILKK